MRAIVLALVLLAAPVWAAETLTLTVPETTPAITTYSVDSLTLNWTRASIMVVVMGTNGERKTFTYEGASARTIMLALNKADLSALSLQRRILQRLTADGFLVGTVTGVPD